MPYMADIEVLNDVKDDVITALVTVLGNGATIRDENGAAEQVSHAQDQAQPTSTPEGVRHPEEPSTLGEEPQPTHEGALPELELRLRSYIDEVGKRVEVRLMSHVDHHMAEMSRKIDALLAEVRRADAPAFNVLQQDPVEEEQGETSNAGAGAINAEQDRDTYVTPNTEVHSGVFVDEMLGDTIVEVTSPISGKKIRTRKRAAPLCSPFTCERPKRKKNEVVYHPTRELDESRLSAVNQWISSESEPKTIRGGTSDLTKDFFRELLKVGEWLSNEVRFLNKTIFQFKQHEKNQVYSRYGY